MPELGRIWAIVSFSFNGETYSAVNGGPLDWDYDDSSNEIGSRVADQIYPGAIIIPERDLELTIVMRDPYTAIAPGTNGNLVLTLKEGDGVADEVLTFASMTFLHQRAGGRKSTEAQSTLVFRYEGSGTGRIART